MVDGRPRTKEPQWSTGEIRPQNQGVYGPSLSTRRPQGHEYGVGGSRLNKWEMRVTKKRRREEQGGGGGRRGKRRKEELKEEEEKGPGCGTHKSEHAGGWE